MLDRSGDVIGRKEDFRVNTCSIHERTGALLLSPDYELLMIGKSSGEMAASFVRTINFLYITSYCAADEATAAEYVPLYPDNVRTNHVPAELFGAFNRHNTLLPASQQQDEVVPAHKTYIRDQLYDDDDNYPDANMEDTPAPVLEAFKTNTHFA
jgi:hypothetical protein